MVPIARKDKLVVQELGDETIIYDEQSNHAHRLNRTAALVWRYCDGHKNVADIVDLLQQQLEIPVSENMVWLALDRLEKERLLQDKLIRPEFATKVTRRDVLRKAALVGGMSLLLPVVQSMVAPTPAMAASASCRKRGYAYDYPLHPCCPGLLPINGKCTDRTGRV